MSVVETIAAVRPEVDPIPLVERRMIREQLFGVGHGDVARTISARSASGAVVSTAPRGTRALAARNSPTRGSLRRMAAGLLLFVVLGGLGWALLLRDNDGNEVVTSPIEDEVENTTVVETTVTPASTAAPTTVAAPLIRTGVTADFPIVMPVDPLEVETVSIDAPSPGSSALILRAPDGTNQWLAEIDGDVNGTDGQDVQPVGSVDVATPSSYEDGDLASYRLQVPCGFVLLNDAPGQPLYRPAIEGLFEATSIDAAATISMSLPENWSVVDAGPSVNSFTAQFQVPVGDTTAPVTLSQVPGGSIAQLTFGGRQLDMTTFLGDDALIENQPLSPQATSVYWRDGDTAFNVRSDQLGFAELEAFVESLEAVEIADWETRYDLQEPPAPVLESTCTPQPSFGPSLIS